MKKADSYRTATVMGLGLSGLSAARFLSAQGACVTVIDTRAQPPMKGELEAALPDVTLISDPEPDILATHPEIVVLSPGLSRHAPYVERVARRGIEVIGDIELFARYCTAPVAAITGSNGKSTVTTLLGVICRAAGVDAQVGGNLGTPALVLLERPSPDVYVLELSSFQLETTESLAPEVAAILNISTDHMDRYRDIDEYASAKSRILKGARKVVLNRDDPRVLSLVDNDDPRIETFGLTAPKNARGYGVVRTANSVELLAGGRAVIDVENLRLQGQHNWSNILAALAMAASMGIDPSEPVIEAIAQFRGLPHRCELLGDWGGVRWINDSKGTNVGATSTAIQGMNRSVVLIAGGQGKGADFGPLLQAAAQTVRRAVLFGEDANQLAEAFSGRVPTERVDHLEDAVRLARQVARAGDVVLFSPACASFDMFNNYEHRGEVFRQLVLEQHQ